MVARSLLPVQRMGNPTPYHESEPITKNEDKVAHELGIKVPGTGSEIIRNIF